MSTFILPLIVLLFNNLLPELEAQNDRIHNGTPAEVGDFPYMVLIWMGGYCSGSIITTTWVLTAAHCTEKKIESYTVIVGTVNYNGEDEYAQRRKVKRLLSHPEYEPFPFEEVPGGMSALNDVGLIEVSEPFVFNQYVHGVAIWGSSLPYGPTNNCQMIGFGRTHDSTEFATLNHVPASSINDCSTINQHNISKLFSGENYACLHGNKIQRVAPGDSGGPLVCHGHQYGVVFDVLELSKEYGYENLYTTTSGYLKWIKQYVPDVKICYNEQCL